MEELKNLGLTVNDFQLLVDGLDALPEKGMAGSLMVDLLGGMITKDNEEAKSQFERERDERRAKQEREKASMIEDVKILQGKLLVMKRYMQQNNLLKEANEIIQPNIQS